MTSGSSDSNCRFMDLPEELRGRIIRRVPQQESLNLRLVSRQWNADVDNHFKFHVKNLDENSPHFQDMIKLRIRTLNIIQLVETSILNPQGECIFKYPNLIRRLWISRKPITEEGGNALQSPIDLLPFCMKNLREFHLTSGNLVYPYGLPMVYPAAQTYNLEGLKRLKIEIYVPSYGLPAIHELERSATFLQQLTNSSMPKLRHLRLKVNFMKPEVKLKCQLILNALRLVAKHGKDLETLHLHFIDREFKGKPSTPILDVQTLSSEQLLMVKSELEVLQQFNKLKDIWFCAMPEVTEERNFWQNFILNRRHLISVNFTSYVIPFSPNLCREFVHNNFATLVRIYSLVLTMLGESRPFDLAVFQTCLNLKFLDLSGHSDNHSVHVNREVIQFVNIASLPPNIITLKLTGFKISSADLLSSSSDEAQLKKLQWLDLGCCHKFDSTDSGVTGTVLENLLSTASNRSLVRIRLFFAFNYSDVEEQEKLNAFFTKFGYPLIDSENSYGRYDNEIKLARDSVLEEWHVVPSYIREIYS